MDTTHKCHVAETPQEPQTCSHAKHAGTAHRRPELHAGNASGAAYTCPMHPEVQSDRPGDCPKCGMALEATDASAEADDGELREMTRRFGIAALLSLPLLLIVMGDMLPGSPVSAWLGHGARVWLELVLATPVCIWAA